MKRVLAIIALAGVAAAPASPVTTLAGRYSKHFQNGFVDGSKYWSDDVVEIVPVDATHAYFRASLQFFNGHECDISGVAKAVGNTLVYAEKADQGNGKICRLTISASGRMLRLDDGDGSCHVYCGARGTLSDFRFIPLSSKRPIGYMTTLRNSDEYKAAIADWRSGKTE